MSSSAVPASNKSPEPVLLRRRSSACNCSSISPEPLTSRSRSPTMSSSLLRMMPDPLFLTERRLGRVMNILSVPMSRTQRSNSISQIPLRTSHSSSLRTLGLPSTTTRCSVPMRMSTSAEMSSTMPSKLLRLRLSVTTLPSPKTQRKGASSSMSMKQPETSSTSAAARLIP